jgi:hypothetical protein
MTAEKDKKQENSSRDRSLICNDSHCCRMQLRTIPWIGSRKRVRDEEERSIRRTIYR